MTSSEILTAIGPIAERELAPGQGPLEAMAESDEPFVVRGLAASWGLVRQARKDAGRVSDYLRGFDGEVPVVASLGAPENRGRVFYRDDLAAMNFEQVETRLAWVLEQLDAQGDEEPARTIYLGSTAIDYCLPGFDKENHLDLPGINPTVRIWLGNQHRVAAHYDVLENIAVVGAGRRRFILFPPEQLPNLYVGPIDFTPAGQPVSLVDFEQPDPERFPRFSAALEHARTAVLEPGDAVYIPSMWWHHVEGLDKLNILVNHWWYPGPGYMGAPLDALLHAILSIRELPPRQREVWRLFFDHYVFSGGQDAAAHLPPERRGALGALDENTARRLRMLLRNKLSK